MSPAVVIVPVMLLIVAAAITLVAVLAFPYRGKPVPSGLWGAATIDRSLETIADQLGVGRHPAVEEERERESVSASSSAQAPSAQGSSAQAPSAQAPSAQGRPR